MTATPFSTLLVANRGEIARRVIRSARTMGLRTVAVYSDADRHAPHVTEADLSVCLGPAAPGESYLSIKAIIAAAGRAGAEAIHPGYGFLSENANFARACSEAGLVFVGPRAETIATMGDKAAAKAAMASAGLPCLPGADLDDPDDDVALRTAADRIGYPVMLKAVAGGGGRGMRRVDTPDALPGALRAARAEAASAFGDDRVMLERALIATRHVEIQVLGDRHGSVIHLGERDCSVQRRNQKLVEEAPCPGIDAAQRTRMGEAAVRAAAAIGYEGAGTFEFLLDAEGSYYFMEMNTRLQVEHPVTEALTGLDLVALQLKIAMGEPLPLAQSEVRLEGHSIEVRLCAEDAEFVPQAGRIAAWHPAPGLRVDAGIETGTEIPPHYNSLVAKLIAHGPDRETARTALLRGLRETVVFGVETNLGLLAQVLEHPEFASGTATTGFLGTHGAAMAPPAAAAGTIRLAALLLRLTATGMSGGAEAGRAAACGFFVPLRLSLRGETHEVDVAPLNDGGLRARDESGQTDLKLLARHAGAVEVDVDGLGLRIPVWRSGDRLDFLWQGEIWHFEDLSMRSETAVGGASDGVLMAPMSGLVHAIHCEVGARIEAGTPILSLEAMKMEHDLALPVDGTLAELRVSAGAQVRAGQVLALFSRDD